MRYGLLLAMILLLSGPTLQAGDYDFTIPEADTKPYELGGRLEARYIYHRLDATSTRSGLLYDQDDPGADTHEWRALAELSGSYRRGHFQANLLTHHAYTDRYQDDGWDNQVYEGYVSFAPTARLTLDAGKKRILWGKGYAWNPVGVLNRRKDPDDPALSLEGRPLVGLDLIKSFTDGRLANVGLTGLLLPVIDDWGNEDLGDKGDLNLALKLYLLWYDTDLDFIYCDGPDQPRSFGFDFARNLAENFEVHGELAFRGDVPRTIADAAGTVRTTREDQVSSLLGIRYLNALETTFIAEYYHNGAGYSTDELDDFYTYQAAAFDQWQATGDASVAERANQIARLYAQQGNYGADYVYFKCSQKEPMDILYFNPWLTAIINLRDFSYNLQPGFIWTRTTNLEISFRAGIPVGPPQTEFGEKPDALRPEIWIRYYF